LQFIEKNSFNVRSAIYRLKKEDGGPEFILFPMIHIGSKTYYDEVHRRLSACDRIFIEGIRSKKARILTLSYELLAKKKSLGLVTQQALKLSEFHERIVNADLDNVAFEEKWASIPISLKIFFALATAFYVPYLFLFGTKKVIAETLAYDDLESRNEILNYDERFKKLDDLIIDERDRKLICVLQQFLQENGMSKKVAGILYGAGHMRPIIQLLHWSGYSIAEAEWITVFDL